MSLATRCSACGTVFRVVQDQLKVSEGWVRCGRCDEVFNALEGLFDLERDPVPEIAAPPQPPSADTGAEGQPVRDGDGDGTERQATLAERIDEQLSSTRRTIAPPLARRDETPDFADARFPDEDLLSEPARDPALATTQLDSRPVLDQTPTGFAPDSASDAAEPAPEFLRRAEREARWRSPGARLALGSGIVLAAAALAGQWAVHDRDLLAARWPAAAPALALACEALGCTLQPPRRLDALSVESTSLAPSGGSAQAFRLSVVLRNRDALPAAAPWIDLTLTDATGRTIARRALAPADFRLASATLPPAAETQLQAVLGTGDLPVSGYTVEIFYP